MPIKKLTKDEVVADMVNLGIKPGDTVWLTANLGRIGVIESRRETAKNFIDCILECVGEEGTLVALSYTDGTFIKDPKQEDAFHSEKKSYAGALPNAMLAYPNSFRSQHPMCSVVAIGKNGKYVTDGHDENSYSYEPVKKLMELNGKCVTLGCAYETPGYTTTHWAETKLGFHQKLIFTKSLYKAGYKTENGEFKLYRRKDPGMCTENFPTLLGHYLRHGVLQTGMIGSAYTIIGEAKKLYDVDIKILKQDKQFHLCKKNDCFQCRMNRWDTAYFAPFYFAKKLLLALSRRLKTRLS
ncbi:MAG: hypothetical protein CME62_08755 [Halobacteriovoraceae bacterium]|nr:hypothetical protein [Halobacteriovoraceae bacterium]|tara:strand:+ start:3562 stop:4452 length:891 start_codon:yes stop_codon:yes gene_type:complete